MNETTDLQLALLDSAYVAFIKAKGGEVVPTDAQLLAWRIAQADILDTRPENVMLPVDREILFRTLGLKEKK